MASEKIKPEYQKLRDEEIKKWNAMPQEARDMWDEVLYMDVAGFVLWWDTLKAIEGKCGVDVMGIARALRYKWGIKLGRDMAKRTKNHGLKDLFTVFWPPYENPSEVKVLEFTDDVLTVACTKCPAIPLLKEWGKTDEEIKEMGPYLCLMDPGIYKGFNPEFTVYHPPCLLTLGDECCVFRVEDNRPPGRKGK